MFFYKSEKKHVFLWFFYLKINVFNIYGLIDRMNERLLDMQSRHAYHNVHFWGASSKTPAPRPLNKQVSF